MRERAEGRVFVLGGNASTLAFVSDLVPEKGQVIAWLVPLAWTPIGVVLGESWQRVGVAADNIAAWTDQTFPPDDERAFVSSVRDLEILARVGWRAQTPAPGELGEEIVVNPDDCPDEVLDALEHPPEALVNCAVCRRPCVRDHFVWQDRRMCAWDYHAAVFGRRGPWRNEPYEDHHFENLPACAYVARPLLEAERVDAILAVDGIETALARRLLNEVIAADASSAYLAVRTGDGLTLLRERAGEEPAT